MPSFWSKALLPVEASRGHKSAVVASESVNFSVAKGFRLEAQSSPFSLVGIHWLILLTQIVKLLPLCLPKVPDLGFVGNFIEQRKSLEGIPAIVNAIATWTVPLLRFGVSLETVWVKKIWYWMVTFNLGLPWQMNSAKCHCKIEN